MEQNPVILETRGLTKNFGSKTALKEINLSIYRGKIIGLLGPNGSGKTTLIKLISGLIQPSGGEIRINGSPIGIESKNSVAYLPDKSYLNDWMRVADLVTMFGEFYSNFDKELAHKLIHDLRYKLFIAWNRSCAYNNKIIGGNGYAAMLVHSHS